MRDFIPMNSKNKAAFTLAEVLITLGIIGVVAAMTIPGMIHSYKKHLIESRMKETISTLTDLFRRVEEGEGVDLYTLYESASDSSSPLEKSAAFHKIFLKYIKAMQCSPLGYRNDVRQCTAGVTYIHNQNIKKYNGFVTYRSEVLVLPNGVAFSLDNIKSDNTGTIDVDLHISKKMIYGVDFFVLNLASNGRIYAAKRPTEKEGYGFSCNSSFRGADSMVITSVRDRCENPDLDDWQGYAQSYCAALIECNGWKVPNDYPIKF